MPLQGMCLAENNLLAREKMAILNASHLHSSVALHCDFLIYNTSTTIMEYMDAPFKVYSQIWLLNIFNDLLVPNLFIHLVLYSPIYVAR